MRARPHCFLEGTANVKLKSHWRWPKSLAIISLYTHTCRKLQVLVETIIKFE